MKQKNYYQILGVNRKHSKEEIKIAYRKLAKEYHPDMNADNKDAEDIFKDINEAYNVLSNEEKKKRYDKQVNKYKYGFEEEDSVLPNVKYEIKSGMNVINDIFSTILGFKREDSTSNSENVTKRTSNEENFKAKLKPEKGSDIEANLEITLEEAFLGTEKKIAIKGYKGGVKTFSVNVPLGIKDGDKIRLAALGIPGKNGGKNGDLIITVKITEHNDFKLEGSNLIKEITLSPARAVLGGKYRLDIINEEIWVDLPTNIKNGQSIVVEQKGYVLEDGTRNDLILLVNIDIPDNTTDREIKLYEQLLKLENKKSKNNPNKL